jgi:hypothetical protein
MTAALIDPPAVLLGMLNRGFNLSFRMLASSHGHCRFGRKYTGNNLVVK